MSSIKRDYPSGYKFERVKIRQLRLNLVGNSTKLILTEIKEKYFQQVRLECVLKIKDPE